MLSPFACGRQASPSDLNFSFALRVVPPSRSLATNRASGRTSVCRCAGAHDRGESAEGQGLASEFSQFVIDKGLKAPLKDRKPSHLLPPTAVIAAQMDALQMNDWPEADAGVRTAFAFAKPPDAANVLPGEASHTRARSWTGKEEWLTWTEFSDLVHSNPYNILLNCEGWQEVSCLNFPSKRFERAVQAIEVIQREHGEGPHQRAHRFTFLLDRVKEGAYKDCWMTVGVRYGDYGNC